MYGIRGICLQPFGKQGFVGNPGREIAYPLDNSEATAFTVMSLSPSVSTEGLTHISLQKGRLKMYLAPHAFHRGHLENSKKQMSLFLKNSLKHSVSLQQLRRGAVGFFQDTRHSNPCGLELLVTEM